MMKLYRYDKQRECAYNYIIIIKTSILSQSCLLRMKFLIYLFLLISLKYFQIKKLGILIDNVNIYRQSILTKFEFFSC